MLKGHQSWVFENRPVILSTGTVVGPDEGQGPISEDFDIVHGDLTIGQKTWEKAEKALLEEAAQRALDKAGLVSGNIQFYIGGDLMNQIISNTFAVRTLNMPFLGIFGACSTSMEGLAIAAQLVDSGAANYVMAGTCSHNCTAEKQFRYPTEYGSQKPPTAQYTVTGAGVAVLGKSGDGPVVTSATIGRVVDMGITDPFNMGAAMAPAAVDTIQTHFRELNIEPSYYDLIVTGDLATVGVNIARELFDKHQFPIDQTTYNDCGLIIYDREKQAVQSGGSGCGCSATVTYGHLLKRVKSGELKRILVVATGALLSPLSFQQGESIPCIAHAVSIESGGLYA
ncbi:stage V sporulation protein AD [Paenibacillus alginolyticus]|uniref:Stage V sporulation protein AD n=1 Tax=Paenibacillus alginolyticus TaxID=59839 RepID=A0ABT4GI08_9BACL|nr:stage V sporulation protein AD [Paenibacillus alginolyticus]MCY9695816.1 stage V sporulation protein AD [Paenibacillus alginolyticus]MEC0143876.1 stage V sporulation protein AD [Paenibacillus alginolyticus]